MNENLHYQLRVKSDIGMLAVDLVFANKKVVDTPLFFYKSKPVKLEWFDPIESWVEVELTEANYLDQTVRIENKENNSWWLVKFIDLINPTKFKYYNK